MQPRSAGAPDPLLTDVSLSLLPNQLGLVFGRSGSGKTTLLQLVAGLAQQSSGTISFSGPPNAAAAAAAGGNGAAPASGGVLSSEARMAQVWKGWKGCIILFRLAFSWRLPVMRLRCAIWLPFVQPPCPDS